MFLKSYKKTIFSLRLRILRGSELLKKSKNPYIFSNFEENLAIFLKKKNHTKLDEVFNQYICRSLLSRLKKFYLYSFYTKKKLIFPLPREWIKNVETDLIRVNKFVSNFLFIIYALLHIPICFKVLYRILFSYSIIKENSVVFCDSNNLAHLLIQKKESYLLKIIKHNFDLKYEFIYHQCDNLNNKTYIHCDNFFPLKFKSKSKLIIWFMGKLLLNIFKIFFIKPKNLILFREEIIDKQLSYYIDSNGTFAKKYFFLNQSLDFRPLWTYNPKIKTRIVMLNIPSSFYGFKNFKSLQYPKKLFKEILNSWNHHIIFNKLYFEYIRCINPKLETKLGIKPIFVNDIENKYNLDHDEFYVSIFDITPVRKYLRGAMLSQDDYRIGHVCIKFFEDIIKLSNELKFKIIWKQKRSINLERDNKYYWFTANKYNNLIIDSNYSAQNIAKITNLSICAPFTSAAFFENKNGKLNSVFYDPINIILKNDRGAQGQKILNGYEELRSHLIAEMKRNI